MGCGAFRYSATIPGWLPLYWTARKRSTISTLRNAISVRSPWLTRHFVSNKRATRTVWLEGNERERNVIVRFASFEDAQRCYQSPAYQEALKFAKASAERDLCIVEGS